MIDVTHNNKGWDWNGFNMDGLTYSPEVWGSEHYRISNLLGPDGYPLKVGYERPKIGFDLRPCVKR